MTGYRRIDRALQVESAQVRIFGKPDASLHRRMGIALATRTTVAESRTRALEAASRIFVDYD